MLPLLCRRVKSACPDAVPPDFLEDIGRFYRANSLRNLRMTVALFRIVDGLSARGVRAAPIKGPLLAEYVYGDIGLRQIEDLDILVGSADYGCARDLLLGDGYQQFGGTAYGPPPAHQMFRFEGRGEVVELHGRMAPALPHDSFSAERLLARARPATLLGREVLSISPEDLFLLLCLHGMKHRWARVELSCVIGALLAKNVVTDWQGLLQDARAGRCLRRLLIAAVLAREVTGVALPAELDAAVIENDVASYLAHQICVASPEGGPQGAPTGLRGALWEAMSLDTAGASLRRFVSIAYTPNPEDKAWVSLSPGLNWMYYGIRPMRGVAQNVRRVIS